MLVALLALLAFQGPASAQTPGQLAFDVASVKERLGEITASHDPIIRGRRVVSTASTLLDLVTYAYSMRYDELSGGPAWVNSAHFDLQATASGEGALSEADARQMMQALLAERFHLKVHKESQEVPVFALTVAKGGPKMKPAAPDATGNNVTRSGDKGLHMEAARATMEQLARQLSGNAGRPVIDRTGLTGRYAFTLDWYPANRPAPAEGEVVTMFAAVQELGLKLEPSKAPMQKLIIDNAEKPSAN